MNSFKTTSLVLGALATIGLSLYGIGKVEESINLERQWDSATTRGVEPYEVSGIDRKGPFKLEYINVDGDEDFDISRRVGKHLNYGYKGVDFKVSDIEKASR